ncbi:hypothetical protein C8R45DRAFT_383157 [Mycena sanguinolenta]|nr:hypothetical protein C8R45DRAFT_383157 [Mycena sanguinolenta]
MSHSAGCICDRIPSPAPLMPREIPLKALKEIQSVVNALVRTWACTAAETFLYGIYLIMIAQYVYVLRKRGIGRNRFLAFATIALFVLCTAHCVLVLVDIGTRTPLLQLHTTVGGVSLAANVVYVTANVLADAIFIFRCYVIWNSQIKIILLPVFLTLGVAGIGYFNAFSAAVAASKHKAGLGRFSHFFTPALFALSIGTSLFTTFVLMGLTVGRIWVLARAARRVFGAQMASTYYTVCAMILESGALYLCGGIAFIALGLTGPFVSDVIINSETIVLAQLVGIAPTIIAVRVALGESVENMNSFLVPRARMRSSFDHEAIGTAADSVDDEDEVLYIRPESIKVEEV